MWVLPARMSRCRRLWRRLAFEKAPTAAAQLVLCRLSAGLDWEEIGRLSTKWASEYEITMARDFVDRLPTAKNEESGRIFFEFQGTEPILKRIRADLTRRLEDQPVLGLVGHVAPIPGIPVGPQVACLVTISEDKARVRVVSSDGDGHLCAPFGKFSLTRMALTSMSQS